MYSSILLQANELIFTLLLHGLVGVQVVESFGARLICKVPATEGRSTAQLFAVTNRICHKLHASFIIIYHIQH